MCMGHYICKLFNKAGGEDGTIKTVNISADGSTITNTGDSYEFDAGKAKKPLIIHVDGDIFAIVYEDTDGDGNAITVNIDYIPPTFTADRTALNTIVLTFNEAVTGSAISGSFTVAGSGAVTNTAPSGSTTVTLTTSGLTSTSSTPEVNYVAATGDIVDAGTNEVANGGAISATDSVPPTFTAERTATKLNHINIQ